MFYGFVEGSFPTSFGLQFSSYGEKLLLYFVFNLNRGHVITISTVSIENIKTFLRV